MSKRGNSYKKAHNRKKLVPGLLIGLIALVLICVLAIVGYKFYGDKSAKSENSEFAVYDFEEYTLDSYGETSTTILTESGKVSRCYVNIIETPSDGGVATNPTYVSTGGSLELNVTNVKSGYRFEGWYENDKLLSKENKYKLENITKDRVIIAKFSVKYISVTSEAKEELADSSLRKGGGTVSGGGVLINDTSYLEIKAIPDNNYKFYGWKINNDGAIQVAGSKTTLVVGEKATSLTPESNKMYIDISSDTTVIAVFKRNSGFKIYLDMMPQVGSVYFSKDQEEIRKYIDTRETLKTPSSYSANFEYSDSERSLYCIFFYPESKYGNNPRYKGDSFYLVKNDGSLEVIKTDIDDTIRGGECEFKIPAKNTEDIHIIARLKCADPGEVVMVGAKPEAYPESGGTVSGGGTYPQTHDFELRATPNDGYEFVRWEWVEDGAMKTSAENPLVVRPDKIVYYKAIFVKKQYTISLASMTPMGSAEISGLGPVSFSDTDQTRVRKINIKPTTDYEVESVSYAMNGNNYSAFCESTGGDVEIRNITGDVGLYIKMKRVGGYKVSTTVDYDKWITIDASGNISYDAATTCHASMKKDSEAIAQITSGVEPTVYTIIDEKITLNAYVDTGSPYKFVRWTRSDGVAITNATSATIEVNTTDVNEDVTFVAQFETNKVKIEAKADPSDKGSVKVEKSDNIGVDINNTDVDSGSDIILTAKPNSGEEFDCWIVASTGRKLYGEKQKDGSNVLTLKNVTWNETYTAYFTKEEIDITLKVTPAKAGTAKLDDNPPINDSGIYHDIKNGATISLSAVPENGYKFVRWESLGQSGGTPVRYSEPNIQIVNVKEDETYTAVFAEKDYVIKVVSSPVNGGTTSVNNKTGEVHVLPGESVTLDANPSAGYVFEYFTDSAGNKYTDDPLILSSIQGDETFTAHYVEKDVTLTIKAEPADGGTLKFNGNSFTSGNKTSVESGSNIKLEAEPLIGYSFVRWETEGLSGSKGPTAYADPVIEILNVTADEVYTAVFAESYYTIKVVSSPITGGQTAVSGKLDEAKFLPSEKATLTATPLDGYKFDYWTDSSGKRYTDNPLIIDVQGNEIFTAHYVEGKLSITLDGAPREAGYVKFNGNRVDYGKANEIESNTNITLSAEIIDSTKYEFERWENKKGAVYTSNPLTLLNVTESDTYTAVFNLKTGKKGIKVVSSPASGGIATKTISSNGGLAILKAVPRAGYSFVKWQKNGVDFSNSAITTVMDLSDGLIYTAVFVKTSDVDVRSDIIKEHFYNDKRTYTTPVYAVSRATIQKEAEERIAKEKEAQYQDSTPGLKNYQAVEDAKDIFSDIELKEDRSVLLLDSELTTTDGEIMPLSIVSDYSKEDEAAKEQTLKKFGNRYNYEILTCKDVGIPDGFQDGIRTYLWKYQDVHGKDNIYILYDRNDGKYDWVSCIIDEGDTLRFTIDSIGDGCRMTIVKVTID